MNLIKGLHYKWFPDGASLSKLQSTKRECKRKGRRDNTNYPHLQNRSIFASTSFTTIHNHPPKPTSIDSNPLIFISWEKRTIKRHSVSCKGYSGSCTFSQKPVRFRILTQELSLLTIRILERKSRENACFSREEGGAA